MKTIFDSFLGCHYKDMIEKRNKQFVILKFTLLDNLRTNCFRSIDNIEAARESIPDNPICLLDVVLNTWPYISFELEAFTEEFGFASIHNSMGARTNA